MLNQHVFWIPVRPHSPVKLFQFLEGFDVRVRVVSVISLSCGQQLSKFHKRIRILYICVKYSCFNSFWCITVSPHRMQLNKYTVCFLNSSSYIFPRSVTTPHTYTKDPTSISVFSNRNFCGDWVKSGQGCSGECWCPYLFFTSAVDARIQPRAPAGLLLGKDPVEYFGVFSCCHSGLWDCRCS